MSVPIFCMFLVSEKLHRKSSRKKSGNSPKLFCDGRSHVPEAQHQRPHRAPAPPLGAALGPPAPRGAQGPRGSSGTDLLPYLFFCPETFISATLFPELDPRRRRHQNPKTEVQQTCPGTLPEWEIVIGGFFITMPASVEMRE